jgi:hypothetical protein
MARRLRWIAALALGAAAASCLDKAPPHTPASASSDMEPGAAVTVQVHYHRASVFSSAARPQTFHVIADYRGASSRQQYPGIWDEETQTLSATVTVPLRAENLVYVLDPAIQPGADTTITAARGRLWDVPCPSDVDPLNACHLLQILR